MRTRVGIAGVVLLAGVAGCGGDTGSSDDTITVFTDVYPLNWLASELGGAEVTVADLTEGGGDPHDTELSPQRVAEMGEADLVVYISGMQPAVDDAVAEHAADRAFDAAEVTELREVPEDEGGGTDPHLWLDPQAFAEVADALAARLDEAGVSGPEVSAAAEETTSTLDALDTEYTDGLADCDTRTFVVSHAAFGYLADRYDLQQLAIAGIGDENEPSPARIREVATQMNDEGIDTVFAEPESEHDSAEVVAEETGAETALLDPAEVLTDHSAGDDYPQVMRANLDGLRTALDCA